MTNDERRDFGHIYRRGSIYWIRYAVNGRRYRESTGSTSKREAEKVLARRQAELGLGAFTAPDAKRVSFEDLAQMIRDDYTVRGRRSLPTLERSLAHLETVFGGCRALAITADRITAYERQRLEEGAARSTVNKELAALRRMFTLAIKARRLPASARPAISTPDPHNARRGFFEEADFRAVLAELPEPLRPVMTFAYRTGWRLSEVLGLTWDRVDFRAGIVRLDPNTTKTNEGRLFPFDALPDLADLLRHQRDHTDTLERRLGRVIPHVFHRDGEPIRSVYHAWRSACKRAATVERNGLTVTVRPQLLDRVPHDFRRTAARNLIRAGVAQHVVMKLCGWKTDAMFRRYAIVDEQDLRDAVSKLADAGAGAQKGHNGGSERAAAG